MSVFVTTEEAREYCAYELGNGLELPRNVNLTHVGNHIGSTIIFAAMGEPGQSHDIRKIFTAFCVRTPKWHQDHLVKQVKRTNAESFFDKYEEEARERLAKGESPSILEGLQFAAANEWKFDDLPVMIYAGNRDGTLAKVTHMGGFMEVDDPNWHNIAHGIEFGIEREFPPTNQ